MTVATDEAGKEPTAAYIALGALDAVALDTGGARKRCLTGEFIVIDQVEIPRGGGEGLGVSDSTRALYVVEGNGSIRIGPDDHELVSGNLVVVPPGVAPGAQLVVASGAMVLLEITSSAPSGGAAPAAVDAATSLRIVRPEDVDAYEPAGHAKTTNRCLYIDDRVEIIEGLIEVGGGADRHFHEHNEQALYVLNAPELLIVHYPRRAPHGTGGGIADPLHLLVVYAPPLGESQNALG
jgi:quercetin dioxygenase-like cupin family protein